MANVRDLTPIEEAAVAAFAREHGRRWKSILRHVYWYNARVWRWAGEEYGTLLHALRNDPRWSFDGLDAYRLPASAMMPTGEEG